MQPWRPVRWRWRFPSLLNEAALEAFSIGWFDPRRFRLNQSRFVT
jgi:hypothetical protein